MMSNQNDQEKEKKPILGFLSKKMRRVIISVIAILIVVALTAIGLGTYFNTRSKTTRIGFEDIGELATQSAYCTEVNVTDAARKLWGWKVPGTQSKYIYSYDVVIKAGFNFQEIEWDEKGNVIEVKLPKAEVLSCDIDENSLKVYLEDESIFKQITLEDNNKARKELKANAEKDAVANGLLDNARSNAETILTGFFGNVYDLDKYSIEFQDK